jgi:hypothetical protein
MLLHSFGERKFPEFQTRKGVGDFAASALLQMSEPLWRFAVCLYSFILRAAHLRQTYQLPQF